MAHPFRHLQLPFGSHPELHTIHSRLARLARLPIIPLFIFDGPARPTHKRNHSVKQSETWIAGDFRELIVAYGFDFHIAPGEAEAELALPNKAGYLDAVYTDDSDVLVFGATNVLRRLVMHKRSCIHFTDLLPGVTARARMGKRSGYTERL